MCCSTCGHGHTKCGNARKPPWRQFKGTRPRKALSLGDGSGAFALLSPSSASCQCGILTPFIPTVTAPGLINHDVNLLTPRSPLSLYALHRIHLAIMKSKPDLENDISYIKTPKPAPSIFEAVDCGIPTTQVSTFTCLPVKQGQLLCADLA